MVDAGTRVRYRGSVKRIMAIALLAMLACSDQTAPDFPPPIGAVELAHDAQFIKLWQEVERCSGISANHTAVRIYSVPLDRIPVNGQDAAGYYDVRRHAIFIAESYITWRNGWRHEILHSLLRATGHPAYYFVTLCGPLVDPAR